VTYSIVACDRAPGAVGVAVQTGDFAVGTVVPRGRPGVGAVATQAFGEPAYGWRVLDAIEQGADAAAALAAARSADPDAALRQVGVVSHDGSADAFTGALCIDHADIMSVMAMPCRRTWRHHLACCLRWQKRSSALVVRSPSVSPPRCTQARLQAETRGRHVSRIAGRGRHEHGRRRARR